MFSSPVPGDTQAFSQFVHPSTAEKEEEEGVLGYLISLNNGDIMTMHLDKAGCSKTNNEAENEANRSAGFLCGRHPENGMSLHLL